MKVHLKVWRQTGPTAKGRLVDYTADPEAARAAINA